MGQLRQFRVIVTGAKRHSCRTAPNYIIHMVRWGVVGPGKGEFRHIKVVMIGINSHRAQVAHPSGQVMRCVVSLEGELRQSPVIVTETLRPATDLQLVYHLHGQMTMSGADGVTASLYNLRC